MKERIEDELWMKKVKERLEDYSEPLPVSSWEQLEKKQSVSEMLVPEGVRTIPYRRLAVAVAVLLITISSVSLWLLQSPVGDEVRRTNASYLTATPDYLPQQTMPSMQTHVTEPLSQAAKSSPIKKKSKQSLVAQQIEILPGKEQKATTSSEAWEDIDKRQPKEPAIAPTENIEAPRLKEVETKQTEHRHRSGKEKLHLSTQTKSPSKINGWSMGLSVGNTGGLENLMGNNMESLPYNSLGSGSERLDLAATAIGVVPVSDEQELIFKNGLPYLQNQKNNIVSIDHKQPINFGLSFRKNLPKGFSVETGLTYTYLASDVFFEGRSEKVSRKLHYLGIPIRTNWSFVNKEAFTLYVSVGGAVEKCAYGKTGSKKETVKPVQLSVMGAAGAQYNISKKVGLYLEPGVSYFFDDGSKIETIRKENPCNFTLQAGVRLMY